MGLGFLSGRREGRVVRMRGRGCGFFCCVACEGVFLVEWGRTVLERVGSDSPPTVRFGITPLGKNVKGVRVT